MSVINSFTQHTINLTRKALRLGSDFVHPVHDDTPDEPDYLSNADVPVETNIALPHSDDWDDGHLTVTDIDPATGLLTTSTEGNPPLDEGTSIYDLYADRAERMGDEPLYTYKSGNDWVTITANEFLADVRAVAKGLIHYGLKKGRCRGIHVPNFLRLGPDRRGDHGVRRRARHHLRHRFRRADSQYRQQLRCPTADRAGHGHA